MWTPRVLVAVGFLMLLLTSLQGWGMVGIIAFVDEAQSQQLLHELRRLHNLGLSGGFLAISFGLAMILLPLGEDRSRRICQILLPSLLIAPVGFTDRALIAVVGPMPFALQAFLYVLQALSALGITVGLAMIAVFLFRGGRS